MGREFLIYQVSVGERQPFYDVCIDSVERYCERHDLHHHVQREPLLKISPKKSARSENALRLGYLPIYEKQAAFAHLIDFDRICIVDADVFIRDSAPNIFDELWDADFAGVLERDMPLTPEYFAKIRKHSEGQFSTLTDVDWKWNENGAAFYNMGVMLIGNGFRDYLDGQTPAQFLRRPEFERFVNGEGHWKWSTDQSLLNWWVKKSRMKTKDLSWKWNSLYGATTELGHFVHFFLSAKMPQQGREIPRIIESLRHHA